MSSTGRIEPADVVMCSLGAPGLLSTEGRRLAAAEELKRSTAVGVGYPPGSPGDLRRSVVADLVLGLVASLFADGSLDRPIAGLPPEGGLTVDEQVAQWSSSLDLGDVIQLEDALRMFRAAVTAVVDFVRFRPELGWPPELR
jgi:hypothetical protein